MVLHQYDPKGVTVIAGPSPVTGFASGSFCLIEFNNDRFTIDVGAGGEAVRSKSNDNSARVTIRLQPGAAGNVILNGFATADRAANAGVFPLVITDLSTGSTYTTATGAWVTKDPGQDFQTEAQPKEWVLETDDLLTFHGAAV